MAGRDAPLGWLDHGTGTLIGAVVFALAILNVNLAPAAGGQPLQLVSAPIAQTAGPVGEPSVLDRIARWFDRSVANLDEGLRDAFGSTERSPPRTKDNVRHTAKDPTDSGPLSTAIPDVRIVTERVMCPYAANGAPDCRRAAETVCRGKGFASGKSLETRSEEKCSLGAMLARRAGQPDMCRNRTYVVRSICQ